MSGIVIPPWMVDYWSFFADETYAGKEKSIELPQPESHFKEIRPGVNIMEFAHSNGLKPLEFKFKLHEFNGNIRKKVGVLNKGRTVLQAYAALNDNSSGHYKEVQAKMIGQIFKDETGKWEGGEDDPDGYEMKVYEYQLNIDGAFVYDISLWKLKMKIGDIDYTQGAAAIVL